jgi:hypothetical protein
MKTIQISSLAAATLAVFLSLTAIPTVMANDSYSGSYSSGSYGGYGYSSSVYGTNAYADTSTTYYDGYQQAWRYLGWYVDCNGGSSRYYDRSGGGGSQSGSGDSAVYGNNYCQRYLMWAAVSILMTQC